MLSFLNQILSDTVFQTVFSGTVVFVLGQIIQLFIIKKIYKYREILGRIDNRLKLHSKLFKNSGNINQRVDDRVQVASQDLLQLSCDLESSRKQLTFRCKQTDRKVSLAAKLLMELHFDMFSDSGSGADGENFEKVRRIRGLLNIPDLSG